ncbi:hypothetical protein RBB50_001735 [Rhinocladiella similis]
MAPTQDAASPGNNVKDAMYLVSFLQQNPQAITFNVSPLAEKTGAKARSIEARLKTIRKRNGLNIVITVNSSSGGGGDIATSKPKAIKQVKTEPTVVVKRENDDRHTIIIADGHPFPTESTVCAAGTAAVTKSKPHGQKKRSANAIKKEHDEDYQDQGQGLAKRIKK